MKNIPARGIRINQLQEKLGLKKTKIYGLIKEGKLPPPAKLGRASVWLESEVDKALLSFFSSESNHNGDER